jgi:hypothetical protein
MKDDCYLLAGMSVYVVAVDKRVRLFFFMA